MAYGKGTHSASDVTSVVLANIGTIKEHEFGKTLVRLVKLSWKTRDGQMVEEQDPRVDVREYKMGRWEGWGKGLSMKLEDYRQLKGLLPAIDLALKHQGIEV